MTNTSVFELDQGFTGLEVLLLRDLVVFYRDGATGLVKDGSFGSGRDFRHGVDDCACVVVYNGWLCEVRWQVAEWVIYEEQGSSKQLGVHTPTSPHKLCMFSNREGGSSAERIYCSEH